MSKYHFVGIGGIGMSGLAHILLQKKIHISGSDLSRNDNVDRLAALGAQISYSHAKENVPINASLVVSTGIPENNPELVQAKLLNLPILHRSDLLHLLMKDAKPLLVAGTHGKTTTTSLLTHALLQSGLNPSYAIGGILNSTGTNAAHGTGSFFVAEADESDGSFLRYDPFGAIITNIDNDHMDHYGAFDQLESAFSKFASKVQSKDHLFYCGDDARLKGFPGVSYGFSECCTLQGSHFRQNGFQITFDATFKGVFYKDIEVSMVGYHNALNALAVFGMLIACGIEEDVIREAFKSFRGVKRRQEKKGECHLVEVIDDYGHHPSEIEATLRALKMAYPYRRLIALFQPHRYSRTLHCLEQFGSCFNAADAVIVTDIYGAGEEPLALINAEKIVEKIKEQSVVNVSYVPQSELLQRALETARPFDVFITLGAGDITKFGTTFLNALKQAPPKKFNLGLIYGGESAEHEISIRSMNNILQGLDQNAFNVQKCYIEKNGNFDFSSLLSLDVVFPCVHGTYGEDGTLQGLLEMLKIPYAGCSVAPSAICMDKALTKKLVEKAGLRVSPSIDFSIHEWNQNKDELLKNVGEFPLYVKPVHLGSTVGVSRAFDRSSLVDAIELAFKLDNHVLIEKEVKGREIEFAVLGSSSIDVFPPGEIFTQGGTYDYQAKYSNQPMPTTEKADLDEKTIEKGMDFAKKAYLACRCDGFARVDCFLEKDGSFILNEINPIPGFTSNSLYPKMCAANGLELKELLSILVCIGLTRARRRVSLS